MHCRDTQCRGLCKHSLGAPECSADRSEGRAGRRGCPGSPEQHTRRGNTKTLCWHIWKGLGGCPASGHQLATLPWAPALAHGMLVRLRGRQVYSQVCQADVKCLKRPLHFHGLKFSFQFSLESNNEGTGPQNTCTQVYRQSLLVLCCLETWGWSGSACCSTHRLERQ